MHITLDYLVVGLIIIIVLAFSANSIFSLTSVNLQHVQEEQLNPLAERLLDKILLTPGEPLNWEDIYNYPDEEDITGFGLGYIKKQDQLMFIDPYVLDLNKVSRMSIIDFQPSPNRILKILGLTWDGEHPKYGFRLRIAPALNITITPTEYIGQAPAVFNISVKSYDGYPAANAKVKAIYLVMQMKKKGNEEEVIPWRSSTTLLANWRGECSSVDFKQFLNSISSSDVEAYILLVYASYFGVKSFNHYAKYPDILDAWITGNYLVVKFPESQEGPQGARHIRGLIQIGEDLIATANIKDVKNPKTGEGQWIINKGRYSLRIYEMEGKGIDPSLNLDLLYIFWAPLPGRDRYCLVLVNYPPIIDYSALSPLIEGLKIFTTHRYCKMGGLTYVTELSVWRMAE